MLTKALNLNKRISMAMVGLKPAGLVDTQTASFFFQQKALGMQKMEFQSTAITREQSVRFFSISSSSEESDGEHGQRF